MKFLLFYGQLPILWKKMKRDEKERKKERKKNEQKNKRKKNKRYKVRKIGMLRHSYGG